MGREEIAELIKRRRRQIWIHSIIYYELNDNIISDQKWSEWAVELEKLQAQYPDISEEVEFADVFRDFDHSTGSNLPLYDNEMYQRAVKLLTWIRQRRMRGNNDSCNC